MIWSFYVFVVAVLCSCNAQNYDTYPMLNQGEDKIIVQANIGDNVWIYCNVSLTIGTTWEVNGTTLDFNILDGSSSNSGYDFSVGTDLLLKHNLSIVPYFMAEHDRLEVICRTGNPTPFDIFLFGIPAGPVLDNVTDVYDVIEGEVFTLDLSGTSNPFPPYITSLWTINGQELTPNISQFLNISTGDYSITIWNAARESTGAIFTVNVSNAITFDSKSFSLDILYPPEAKMVYNNSKVYGPINGSAELLAVSMLGGNPYPNITWFDPANEIIDFPHPRFEMKVNGTLNIRLIQPSDFNGSFVFTANNGIGNELVVEVILIEAIKPGQPKSLSITDIGSHFVSISWDAPDFIGVPTFTGYSIFYNQKEFRTVDTALYIGDLLPGQVGTVTVRATSDIFIDGGDYNYLSFQTDFTRVNITNATSRNENGGITVYYSFLHTGGFDKEVVSIKILCDRGDTIFTSGTGSGNTDDGSGGSESADTDLAYTCSMNCLNNDLSGIKTVSNKSLQAGDSYVCGIIADNPRGSVLQEIPEVDIITGLPSHPIINDLTISNDSVTVTLRSKHAGIDPKDDRAEFSFHVLVRITESDKAYAYNNTHSVTGYRSNSEKPISFTLSQQGEYTLLARASNEYGSSDITELTLSITFRYTPTVSSSPSDNPRTNKTGDPGITPIAIIAISASAAAAGLILVIIVVLVLIGIVVSTHNAKVIKVKPKQSSDDVMEEGEEKSHIASTSL